MKQFSSNARMIWCGALASVAVGILFALSFIATPVKFLAADISTADLLAVGRVTFRASLVVELVLLAILLILATNQLRFLLLAVGSILAVQWLILMPLLDARTLETIAGRPPSSSNLHIYWIAADVLRIVLYTVLAASSFKSESRSR